MSAAQGVPESGDLHAGRAPLPWAIVVATDGGGRKGRAGAADVHPASASRRLGRAAAQASRIVGPAHALIILPGGAPSDRPAPVTGAASAHVLEQPRDRGTAASILLPLAHLMEDTPDAVVAILPADPRVFPRRCLPEDVLDACLVASEHPGHVILLGTRAMIPGTEGEWIEPGECVASWLSPFLDREPARIVRFCEPVAGGEAGARPPGCALWSSRLLVATARTLWSLAEERLPDAATRFTTLRQVVRAVRQVRAAERHEYLALGSVYAGLGRGDFYRDVVARVPARCLVLPVDGAGREWHTFRPAMTTRGPTGSRGGRAGRSSPAAASS